MVRVNCFLPKLRTSEAQREILQGRTLSKPLYVSVEHSLSPSLTDLPGIFQVFERLHVLDSFCLC